MSDSDSHTRVSNFSWHQFLKFDYGEREANHPYELLQKKKEYILKIINTFFIIKTLSPCLKIGVLLKNCRHTLIYSIEITGFIRPHLRSLRKKTDYLDKYFKIRLGILSTVHWWPIDNQKSPF